MRTWFLASVCYAGGTFLTVREGMYAAAALFALLCILCAIRDLGERLSE